MGYVQYRYSNTLLPGIASYCTPRGREGVCSSLCVEEMPAASRHRRETHSHDMSDLVQNIYIHDLFHPGRHFPAEHDHTTPGQVRKVV
jgi:hypothetical protein